MSINDDIKLTLENKQKLESNQKLMFWYHECFKHQFELIPNPETLRILEIGSGTSPFKQFNKKIITSDVMPLEHVDFCFDAMKLSEHKELIDNPIDVILMTNVLHHISKPLLFFKEARSILRKSGIIIMTEPFFSHISSPIYKYFHHEPVEFKLSKPELNNVIGPLSSANQALPYSIFYLNDIWKSNILQHYQLAPIRHFSCLSYFYTGGISRNFPFPLSLYRKIFNFDLWLSKHFPKFFSSFMTIKLTKKC